MLSIAQEYIFGVVFSPTGVGEGEFNNKENFLDYLRVSVVALTIHDCDADQKIVAFVMYYPAQLSRSSSPLYLCKYLIFTVWTVNNFSRITGGSRIFQTGIKRAPTPDVGAPTNYLAKIYSKTAYKLNKLTLGGLPWRPHPRICQWHVSVPFVCPRFEFCKLYSFHTSSETSSE